MKKALCSIVLASLGLFPVLKRPLFGQRRMEAASKKAFFAELAKPTEWRLWGSNQDGGPCSVVVMCLSAVQTWLSCDKRNLSQMIYSIVRFWPESDQGSWYDTKAGVCKGLNTACVIRSPLHTPLQDTCGFLGHCLSDMTLKLWSTCSISGVLF